MCARISAGRAFLALVGITVHLAMTQHLRLTEHAEFPPGHVGKLWSWRVDTALELFASGPFDSARDQHRAPVGWV